MPLTDDEEHALALGRDEVDRADKALREARRWVSIMARSLVRGAQPLARAVEELEGALRVEDEAVARLRATLDAIEDLSRRSVGDVDPHAGGLAPPG
ncbi:MAG: hypothetical protein M9894_17110 [Planctomycetes bacterium]|nr:hypothetical protein [Planctomycetota bacterium]